MGFPICKSTPSQNGGSNLKFLQCFMRDRSEYVHPATIQQHRCWSAPSHWHVTWPIYGLAAPIQYYLCATPPSTSTPHRVCTHCVECLENRSFVSILCGKPFIQKLRSRIPFSNTYQTPPIAYICPHQIIAAACFSASATAPYLSFEPCPGHVSKLQHSTRYRPKLLTSDSTPSFSGVSMLPTDLPPEILLLILDRLGPSAFAIAVITCKKFRYVALENRKLLLNKIRCVPGLKQGLEEFTNAHLLRLFRSRASENLLNIQILHDKQIFSFEPSATSSIHASKSTISSSVSPNAALICRNCPLVHLYNFRGHELIPMGVVDALGACDHISASSDVLKVTHYNCDGISILSRPAESCESMQLRKEVYATHLYMPRPMSWMTSWGLVQTPEYRLPPMEAKFRPVAMAVANPELFAISWKREDRLAGAQVWSYKKPRIKSKPHFESEGIAYICEKIYEPSTMDVHCPVPLISSLGITESPDERWEPYRLDICEPARPVPWGSLRLPVSDTVDYSDNPLVEYLTPVDFSSEDDPDDIQFAVDKPFFGCHTHEQSRCQDHYLALGSAINDADTVLILSNKVQPDNEPSDEICRENVDMTGWNRNDINWKPAAQLAGYRRLDTNLQGAVAYSSGCRRIAITNWTNIYIWHFEPHQLIGEYFDDEYYHRLRGQQCVILFPAIIPVGSVVHQLAFGAANEDVLWALTDKGLIVFDIGSNCSGKVRSCTMVVGDTNEEVDGAPGYFVDGRK